MRLAALELWGNLMVVEKFESSEARSGSNSSYVHT